MTVINDIITKSLKTIFSAKTEIDRLITLLSQAKNNVPSINLNQAIRVTELDEVYAAKKTIEDIEKQIRDQISRSERAKGEIFAIVSEYTGHDLLLNFSGNNVKIRIEENSDDDTENGSAFVLFYQGGKI